VSSVQKDEKVAHHTLKQVEKQVWYREHTHTQEEGFARQTDGIDDGDVDEEGEEVVVVV